MTTRSNQYFKNVANQWDSLRSGYFQEAVRETAIQKAYLRPEMSVADIGAGTGFLSSALAPLVQQVHAVDASPEMLAVARNNLAGFSNIHYHEAEGQSIPLPSASMDAVFANMYLHHTPDPLAAIREMVRLLKPGGRLIITDLDTHTHTWMREEMADTWLGFEREQMRQWYRQAGLVNVFVECTDQSCCSSSETQPDAEKAEISVFAAVGTSRVERRKAVQQSYSLIAESGGGCGCDSRSSAITGQSNAGSGCCSGSSSSLGESVSHPVSLGYNASELQVIPAEASELSLGCGNPFALASLKSGETVLDIGSGAGMDAFLAANKVGASGKVIGVDMTPAMLERARQSAQRNGYTQVEFREGQADQLPAEDASVDVVISNCVINLTEDKSAVFAEAFRVLKPGGRLEISDTVSAAGMPEDLRSSTAEWAACVSGSLPEAEYLDLIRAAGFSNVRTQRSSGYTMGDYAQIHSLVVSAVKPDADSPASASGCCGGVSTAGKTGIALGI